MRISITLFTLISFFAAANLVTAQTGADKQIADWERAKAYTLEYLEAMPEEGYALKPTPEMRSFADQMMHLTDANYSFTSAALGTENSFERGAHEKMEDKSKAHVIALVTAGYDYVIDGLKKTDAEKLNESVTLFGRFEMSRQAAMEKAFEHQTHHRGQTTVYLRLAGATPPQEKLF